MRTGSYRIEQKVGVSVLVGLVGQGQVNGAGTERVNWQRRH